jgi:uncharacterized HAD superfamily protein
MRDFWDREKEQKVCSVDLDGVLVSYPDCWVSWVNLNQHTAFKDLNEMKSKLPYNKYRELKKDYRVCGVKASLPAVKDAALFIKTLQDNGFKVIILTARPYRQYREIYDYTMQWLESNSIKPNGIIWEEEKHWTVLREFPYLRFMVEDNATIANQCASLGYKVYLLNNQYNQQPLENCCQRVFSLKDILKCEGLVVE